MIAFRALLLRDLKLAFRLGGDALTQVLFFVIIGILIPFAVGPDKILLARLAPGIIWIAAFLAMLLGQDRLFRADDQDGSLLALRHAAIPLEAVVAAKMTAHWLLSALPLIVASPLLALMLGMDLPTWLLAILSLLLGTPALVGFGTIGAALTVSLKRGGLVGSVLFLPLAVPVLIFGVGAITTASASPLLFLSAISLLACAFSPFAAALALRIGAE